MMLAWLARRRIAAFERSFDYDMSYVRDILAAGWRALRAFAGSQAMTQYRRDLPREVWYAAKLATAMAEDCGPCTQLVVTMAERAGVSPVVLRAVLANNHGAMPAEVALGVRFTTAVLRHDPEADTLREQILAKWGQAALVSFAFVIASARIYPTVKYALGHGRACVRVTVGGTDAVPVAVPVRRAA